MIATIGSKMRSYPPTVQLLLMCSVDTQMRRFAYETMQKEWQARTWIAKPASMEALRADLRRVDPFAAFGDAGSKMPSLVWVLDQSFPFAMASLIDALLRSKALLLHTTASVPFVRLAFSETSGTSR